MIKRELLNELLEMATQYPVVSVMGPRQSGKTTLVQQAFPGRAYVNLEAPDEQLFAKTDPKGFLERFPNGSILDEIQRVPELLSYIQVIVDDKKIKGMFILTGSHQIELHAAISQSLAGRVALLTLYPLSLGELAADGVALELDEQLLKGFYPRVYSDHLDPTKAYRNYIQTYLEKDVRSISEIKNLTQFQLFMKLCAGRIGRIVEYNAFANELGVSSNTIKHWFSILEASFVVTLVKPYFENFGKRIIKAPKLYFNDVGLATYLLDIERTSQIARDPARGFLLENLVLIELMKFRCNQGLDPAIYYFRDNHQNEVDFIIKQGNLLIPIEIKSSKTFHNDFLKGLKYFHKLSPEKIEGGFLIYAGEVEQKIDQFKLLNFRNVVQVFE